MSSKPAWWGTPPQGSAPCCLDTACLLSAHTGTPLLRNTDVPGMCIRGHRAASGHSGPLTRGSLLGFDAPRPWLRLG